MLLFDVEGREVGVEVTSLVIAGWTGRNKEAVQHHIDELAAIGVAPPSSRYENGPSVSEVTRSP